MLEFYLFIFNFMATSTAYGSSPARDWICSNPCHTCSNAWSFDQLPQARDGTCTSAETWAAAVRFLTHCAKGGSSSVGIFERQIFKLIYKLLMYALYYTILRFVYYLFRRSNRVFWWFVNWAASHLAQELI